MSKFEVFVQEEGGVKAVESSIQRRSERKVLGCINNSIPESNIQESKTVFPQKQHRKKQEKNKVAQDLASVLEEEKVTDYYMLNGYSAAVLEHLKKLERQQPIRANYMSKQKELSVHMRGVLIEWLIDVCSQFTPAPEVIYTAVNYLDRFLSVMAVKKCRLQLLGLTCLNVAWKFEDANSRPNLNDLVYFTDDGCTYDEVVEMERLLVRTLDFHLEAATSFHFLHSFLSHHPLPSSSTANQESLLRHALLEPSCSFKHAPSLLASSCLFIFRAEMGLLPWNEDLTVLTGHSLEGMEVCVRELSKVRRKMLSNEVSSLDHKPSRCS